MDAESDYAALRQARLDLEGSTVPVQDWHLQVQQHDIRFQLPRETDGFGPVRGFTNHLHTA